MRTRAIRVFVSVALLALVAAPISTQEDRRHKELPNFHKVNDMVYRGAQPKSGGLELLKQLGIRPSSVLGTTMPERNRKKPARVWPGCNISIFRSSGGAVPKTKRWSRSYQLLTTLPTNPYSFIASTEPIERESSLLSIALRMTDGRANRPRLRQNVTA